MRASQEQAQEPIVKESSAQAQVQEAAVPQPKLSPREQVDAEMAKHGIAKGSYMLFSSEDKIWKPAMGQILFARLMHICIIRKELKRPVLIRLWGRITG